MGHPLDHHHSLRLSKILMTETKQVTDGWMTCNLYPFQQFFGYIRMMTG